MKSTKTDNKLQDVTNENAKLSDKDLENVAGGRSTSTYENNSTSQNSTNTDNTINVPGNLGG
ncbi:hypothetical protein [Francisella salimarina]|uniref:hypothetical protein n=1 Tax=Francisella salimarina TaxID=2599927 RepID=UPI0037501209